MNFFCDESVDAVIATRLVKDGHQVVCVWELQPGIPDETVLEMANSKQAILVTADKDFGELAFRLQHAHHGVLLLRLAGLSQNTKAEVVSSAVKDHGAQMSGAFTVITSALVRIRRS